MSALDAGKTYRDILILEDRNRWESCKSQFDAQRDVVLTYDLGLRREVEQLGGLACYVDHLADKQSMQENNFLIYHFFRKWHFDAEGQDIFQYRGVPLGFSFRLEIWNDFVFYARTRICMEILRGLKYEKLVVGTRLGLIESVLTEMGLAFVPVLPNTGSGKATYYFPIHDWMDEKVRFKGIGGVKYRLRDIVSSLQGSMMSWADRWFGGDKKKPTVFIQEYHPTRKLIKRLQQEDRVRLLLATFSRNKGAFRYIPIWRAASKFQVEADNLMSRFRVQRCAKLVVSNGGDISDGLYRIIETRIANRLAAALRDLDCVIRYLDANPLSLEVLIANLGHLAPLVDSVCKTRGIPSYFIINGILGNEFLDEGKYATVINSYSVSIKEHYFRGMDNIVCLGDPRMDAYAMGEIAQRMINRVMPTITVGASGHNNTDLNSYLAVEFDFLYDVLHALTTIKSRGVALHIIIKVRANGYRKQYERFVQEYFPGLVDEILDSAPMPQVLRRTDFFISIYSQTLFEASCLGIPCLYYKKDTEIMDPPFDGNSELVTVTSVDDLIVAIEDYRSGHKRYDAFLERTVMEKYIGPLDGGNLERNLNFIYQLLEQAKNGPTH
ncbi:hypothetical protein MIZ03_4217 [Rhodoferax lithotrophicus]|uniref:Uncharacterized protein n=1 Tax=Rhodoferax lithotrophicus TaxID=2798804 RepID=A0ABN6DBB9_9BURK|nr:hypothetical protein [Rhodoferax sp. MIZ03]BCO29302.1 hypothetical protein MIZ03_4217 [Rhodoferax sp. MIZ03]